MLVVSLVFYLYSCLLSKDPQDRYWSNKLVNISLPCKAIGNFTSNYTRMSGVPKELHRILSGNVVQRLLALLYEWVRYFL